MVVLFTYQQKMNTNTKKAILELDYLHPDYKKTIDPFIPEILQLIEKFSQSAGYVTSTNSTSHLLIAVIDQLLHSMPLSPIYSNDDIQWELVFDGVYQNKRCGSIFKDHYGAYYLDAIIWCHKENHFNGVVDGIHSAQYIKSFPFYPTTYYINVEFDESSERYHINDMNIKFVFHTYQPSIKYSQKFYYENL